MALDVNKSEIRLSGSGGQGLITVGIILARAAVIDGINVTQTQSYGAASRGGASRADVVISNSEIYYPEAIKFDTLLSLTQESCDKFIGDLKDGGIFICDNSLVKNYPLVNARVYELPFSEIASEKLGSILPTNILALSFLVRVSKVVSEKALKAAISNSMKPAFLDMNLKAMKIGFKLADEYGKEVD